MPLYTVTIWCSATIYPFDIHWVQCYNGLLTSITYLLIVHSSCAVKSGWQSLHFGLLSHSWVNSHNRLACLSISKVKFCHGFTSILRSTVICALASWQSMNTFWQSGVSVLHTARIPCYIMVSFKTLKITWNYYLFNNLCLSWSDGWHLVDPSIALFTKSLTLPNVYAFIFSKLLITLIRIWRVGEAFYTQTTHECIKRSWMMWGMHGMWVFNAGHSILDTSRVNSDFWAVNYYEEVVSVVISSQQLLVNSKRSRTQFRCMARLAPVCCPWAYHMKFASNVGKVESINLNDRELCCSQCPIWFHIVSNDRCCVSFVCWHSPV